jgi:hypothetical protein
MTENLTKDLSQRGYSTLIKAFEDPVSAELTSNLIANFRDVLEDELQKKHNLQQIHAWLIDMLEEIKINYVKNIAEKRMEKIVEEAEQLRYVSQR